MDKELVKMHFKEIIEQTWKNTDKTMVSENYQKIIDKQIEETMVGFQIGVRLEFYLAFCIVQTTLMVAKNEYQIQFPYGEVSQVKK